MKKIIYLLTSGAIITTSCIFQSADASTSCMTTAECCNTICNQPNLRCQNTTTMKCPSGYRKTSADECIANRPPPQSDKTDEKGQYYTQFPTGSCQATPTTCYETTTNTSLPRCACQTQSL